MAANTRTRLNVETLEGRALPAAGFANPVNAGPLVAVHASTPVVKADVVPTVKSPVNMQNGIRIVSKIYVNGELVLNVQGKAMFAGIGPAASGDQNGSVERGGTTLFANGRLLGTFDGPPQVVRDVDIVKNKNGRPVKVVTFYFTGTPYVAPPETTTNAFGGIWVG